MNIFTTKWVIGIVIGVLALAGVVYYVGGFGGAKTALENSGDANVAAAGAYTGSFSELSKRGGDWKCTVKASTADSISGGTVYVSGKHLHGEFTSTVEGYGSVTAYMTNDGDYTYSWSSLYPQGVKARVTAGSSVDGAPTSGEHSELDQSYSYDCQPWQADASLFVVPANLTFIEAVKG